MRFTFYSSWSSDSILSSSIMKSFVCPIYFDEGLFTINNLVLPFRCSLFWCWNNWFFCPFHIESSFYWISTSFSNPSFTWLFSPLKYWGWLMLPYICRKFWMLGFPNLFFIETSPPLSNWFLYSSIDSDFIFIWLLSPLKSCLKP